MKGEQGVRVVREWTRMFNVCAMSPVIIFTHAVFRKREGECKGGWSASRWSVIT